MVLQSIHSSAVGRASNLGRAISAPHIPNYKPKKNEDFMSEGQIEHFKEKLNAWMKQLISDA
jgi:DnaK suppressor protein